MKDNPSTSRQSLADFLGRPVDLESPAWTAQPSLGAVLGSWVWPIRFDRKLAVGVRATPGTALALHARRITSTTERAAVARILRRMEQDARTGTVPPYSARIELNRPNVLAAEALIDAVTIRLRSPRPVDARGMARLRLVLADGCGPLYEFGRGDLNGRLGAALAAL